MSKYKAKSFEVFAMQVTQKVFNDICEAEKTNEWPETMPQFIVEASRAGQIFMDRNYATKYFRIGNIYGDSESIGILNYLVFIPNFGFKQMSELEFNEMFE